MCISLFTWEQERLNNWLGLEQGLLEENVCLAVNKNSRWKYRPLSKTIMENARGPVQTPVPLHVYSIKCFTMCILEIRFYNQIVHICWVDQSECHC